MVLASREEEAYEYAKEMDVDYMMVIFGGYARYSGDDINKFLWIIRIAGNENQHIKEADFLANGVYKIDEGATKTMLNSMMYKMNYYRFGEVNLGKGGGFDNNRNAFIGNKDVKFRFFEEAFTSQNWIVRIYKVKDRGNRDRIAYRPIGDKSVSAVSAGDKVRNIPNFFHKYGKKVGRV